MALTEPPALNCLCVSDCFLPDCSIVTYKMIGKAYDVSRLCGLVFIY